MITVSYSELATFRQCPLKHAIGYKQRWTKPVKADSALAKGTLWHLVLQTHYTSLQQTQERLGRRIHQGAEEVEALGEAIIAVQPLLANPETGEQDPTQALVEWMYQGYIEFYGADRDWLIVAVEHDPMVALPAESGKPSSKYRLKLKIDLVIRDRQSRLWIVDHKSAARFPTSLENDIDDQFGLYIAGMRALGWPVFGAVRSVARTQRNVGDVDGSKIMPLDSRFTRAAMYRTDTELDNLMLDASRTAKAAWGAAGEVPYSSPNPDQCGWKCEFLEAHLLMRKGTPSRTALTSLGFAVDKTRH